MGNKSKRRQGWIRTVDEKGHIRYVYQDIGYGRRKKHRRSRDSNTKTAVKLTDEEMRRIRRERYLERKGLISSETT